MRQPGKHTGIITAALVAAVLTCLLGAGLASAQQAVPESPATSFNETASAVAWTGSGWDAPVDSGSNTLEADERQDAIVAELPPEPPEPQDEPEQPDEPQREPERPNEPQRDSQDEPEPPKEPEQDEPLPEDPAEQPSDPDEDRPKQDSDEGDPVKGPEGQRPGDEGDGDDDEGPVVPPSKDPSPDLPDNPEDPDDPEPEPSDPEPDDPEPQTIIYDDDDGEDDDPVGPPAPSDDDDDTGEGARVPDPDPGQGPGGQEPDPEPDPDEGKYPIITTDLKDGEVIGQDWRTFSVRATDFAGRTLMTDNVRVTVATDGGEPTRLYASGDDGYEIRYRLPVDGANVAVSIRATDAKRRASVLDLTVHRAEEDVAEVVDGSITFSLEAGTVGLGRLLGPMEVEFYEGEQMSSVLVRTLSENGFGAIYKGSVQRSFYLQHVTRAGITDGWEIPNKLMQHLEEVGFTPSDYHEDSLGEFDFTGTSGWMYSVNDVFMSTNMSNYYPADGDEVRIRFTLYRGSDIGGDDGPQWDEEW